MDDANRLTGCKDVLDATETQGASVGMWFCAASATGLCHRSLANRFGTADHQHPEPANGKSWNKMTASGQTRKERQRGAMAVKGVWKLQPLDPQPTLRPERGNG
jgi:hypothetical protein